MELDQLKGSWQAREVEAAPLGAGNLSPLVARLEALDRDVRRRDVREYIAAFAVMAFFGWRAAAESEPVARIGYAIVVLGAMFIIIWSRRAATPSSRGFAGDLPIVRFLERERDRVEAQIRLLKSVWWWYVSPTIIGLLLTLVRDAGPLVVRLVLAAIFIAVGVGIHWLNVTTARTELEPLRDEISERLREFA